MTFLGPVIMAALMIVPLWLTLDKSDHQTIVATNFSSELYNALPEIEGVDYVNNNQLTGSSDSIIKWLNASAELRFEGQELLITSTEVDPLKHQLIAKSLENQLYKQQNATIISFKSKTKYIMESASGRSFQELLSYGMGIGVYFFIFMYGVQIMKGVVEEKTNRIVEVMLCTVKPFEMMMGKIVGISTVGFLQFLLWIGLVLGFESLVSNLLDLDRISGVDINAIGQGANLEVLHSAKAYVDILGEMNLGLILVGFLWFFLFGFLLYAALFAVIGAASDVDTDTQQFIFPLTVPLFGTMLFAQNIVSDPHSSVVSFLSYFPFTSPLAMTMRLPFENEMPWFSLHLIASAIVLFFSFVMITWVASRIYRVGILSYGSKVGYQQLIKWFFERN